MNKKQLRKCESKHVRIRPLVKRFEGGKGGRELPTIDDDWLVGHFTSEGVPISHHTGHGTTLGYDLIYGFTSDSRRGYNFGFLTLTAQIHIAGDDLWIEPNVRPPNST